MTARTSTENTPELPLMQRALAHAGRPAIIDESRRYSYAELLRAARGVAVALLGERGDLEESRIAFMAPPGFEYVATQWGIWLAGGICVPLGLSHPAPELEYVLDDTAAAQIVAHPAFVEKLTPLARARQLPLVQTTPALAQHPGNLPGLSPARRAMILYTSGTTSKPKGVVLTHANLEAQITSLIDAWGWTAADHILHVLPLHHTHGIVNVLCCAMWAGAICEFLSKFDAGAVWERLLAGELTLFMAVPTIYAKLIAWWEQQSRLRQQQLSAAARRLRLMVSGSAALPAALFEKWRDITGQTLLERYGMTEIGMALSNPLQGDRRPGTVGRPLPGVGVRLVDESGGEIREQGVAGEIEVKGPQVFLEYWRRPEATAAAFRDGWFRTGDVALCENGYYRLLGRSSVDIIKSGGYKVSALEIEEVLRAHPAVAECAVVGVPDVVWGECVCAAVILRPGQKLDEEALRSWARPRLAPYKIPRRLCCVAALPRNAMGKVTKPAVKKLFAELANN